MFNYNRILIAVLTFILGISTVWAVSLITAGIGVVGAPFMQPEVIEVAAPRVPEPPAVRFKRHRKHHHHCGKFTEARTK
jgi:hypothetical protein